MKFLVFLIFIFSSIFARSDSHAEIIRRIESGLKARDKVQAINYLRSRVVSLKDHEKSINAGALPVLVAQFTKSKSKKVRDCAFANLYTHAMHSRMSCEAMFELGVLPSVLQRMVSNKRNVNKQIEILNFLGLLSDMNYKVRFFICSRFIEPLKELCKFSNTRCSINSSFLEKMKASLLLITKLTNYDDNINLVFRENNFHHLVEKIISRKLSGEITRLAEGVHDRISPSFEPELIEECEKKRKACVVL
jgi:hypothetical protein